MTLIIIFYTDLKNFLQIYATFGFMWFFIVLIRIRNRDPFESATLITDERHSKDLRKFGGKA
jgi:hypothetical protein